MREDVFFLDPIDIVSPSFSMKKKKKKTITPPPPTVTVSGRTRSAASNRRVSPTNACAAGSKHALNGDLYAGGLSSHAPNGSGKYLWSDGCMYEGEWRRGKPSGNGKFSWPSGAAYEGDFKSGRIEGYGTFVGPHGDTYRGCWVADRKHGHGQKHYANGDFYEGQWKRNVQDGQGRYVWRNGNEYVGEWKNGVISGRGVLVCANGSRFEGTFENGFPKKMNRSAPPPSRQSSSSIQKICIWESDGEAGDITCDIIDSVEPSIFRRGCFSAEAKKPGLTISKGHKNYDLMLNLQLGIRYSVGKHDLIQCELKTSDFDPSEKFWTRFPSEGSRTTPPHQSPEFRWKDYCPAVFRHLRDLFRLDTADYMLAICGNNALRELSSPGKSGSFFYLTHDDRFMIKTVKKSEAKVLIRMLPSYYKHVSKYENTLLTKFFGVHCVKPIGGPKTRFIVMGNLFCSDNQIHRRFDLKGSSHGRTTDKLESEIDETTTLKDLDLNFAFRLQRNWFQELIKQVNRDCEFLEAERIMDYSLLVGVHFCDDTNYDKIGSSPFVFQSGTKDSFQGDKFIKGCRFLESELQNMDQVLSGRKPLIRLGANMPAKAERTARRSDFNRSTLGEITHYTPSRSTETYEVVLYFGIIDILQDYDITKKLEHAYKSLQADPTSISAVDPKLYSKRFRDFIGRVFKEEE